MCLFKCTIFLCLTLVILDANGGVVSFIEPCVYTDVDCLLKSSKKAMPHVIKGIPELGFPSFDPLVFNEINGDNGDLKLKLKDVVVKGLPKCEITKVERPEKLRVEVELVCPITATGHYTLGGKLLVVDIEGDDDFEIKTDKIKISVSIVLKPFEKNGKHYYKFSSFDYKYDALEKVYFTFHNLYHGDKDKAQPIISILDQSWKEITYEVGKPVIKEIITQVIKGIERLFSNTPRSEIERD